MIAALLDPAFNGADLTLCTIAIIAAWLGERHDRKRNHTPETETP